MNNEQFISIHDIERARQTPADALQILEPGIERVFQQVTEAYGDYLGTRLQFRRDRITLLPTRQFWQTLEQIDGIQARTMFQDMNVCAVTTRNEPHQILMNIDDIPTGIEFEALLSEELLHSCGLQTPIKISEDWPDNLNQQMGSAVMEFMVSYLAYKAIGIFSQEEEHIPTELLGQVQNRLLLDRLLSHMPENVHTEIIEMCINGTSDTFQQEVNQIFSDVQTAGDDEPFVQLCTMIGSLYFYETSSEEQGEAYAEILNSFIPKFEPYF